MLYCGYGSLHPLLWTGKAGTYPHENQRRFAGTGSAVSADLCAGAARHGGLQFRQRRPECRRRYQAPTDLPDCCGYLKYYLKFIFKIQNLYLYIWQSNNCDTYDYTRCKFWCETSAKLIKTNKRIFAVDFNNLTEGTQLFEPEMRSILILLRYAIGRRDICYKDVSAGFYVENIYKVIK